VQVYNVCFVDSFQHCKYDSEPKLESVIIQLLSVVNICSRLYYIETNNLILREFRDTDAEGIFKLDSDREVHKYLGNNPIKTMEEAEKIISFFHLQYKERGIGRLACVEKSSGKFIGWAGLKLNLGEKEILNGYTDFIDIGYRLLPNFWGKGYATEASLASIEYGFKILAQIKCSIK